MADAYLLENGTDKYQLEDASGVLLKEPVDLTTRENIFDGGSDGTDISVANSGGGSGDPWDVVGGDSGNVTYETDAAYRGSLGMKIVTGGTADGPSVRWNESISSGKFFSRIYFMFPTAVETQAQLVLVRIATAANSNVAQGQIRTNGTFALVADTTDTGTTVLDPDVWYRLEIMVDLDTNAVEMELFEGESTTTVETWASTTTAADVGRHVLGLSTAESNWGPWYVDDVGVGVTDWIGPSGVAAPGEVDFVGMVPAF